MQGTERCKSDGFEDGERGHAQGMSMAPGIWKKVRK